MTARAFIIGLVLLVGVAVIIAYTDHAPQLILPTSANHLPVIVVGIVLLFSLCINPLLRLLDPKWVFTQAELVVI